jgi:hypothetical protein
MNDEMIMTGIYFSNIVTKKPKISLISSLLDLNGLSASSLIFASTMVDLIFSAFPKLLSLEVSWRSSFRNYRNNVRIDGR